MESVLICETQTVHYFWFAHDVTKNQTKKLSITLSFYFHEVLQHLNDLK